MIEDSPSLTLRRNFPRPDPAKVETLKGVQSGIAVDCLEGSGALHHGIKAVTSGNAAFAGVAITCDCGPADNLAVFAALDMCQPGDVVMIRTGGHLGCAVIGDMVAGMYANAGAVGMVTDGGRPGRCRYRCCGAYLVLLQPSPPTPRPATAPAQRDCRSLWGMFM